MVQALWWTEKIITNEGFRLEIGFGGYRGGKGGGGGRCRERGIRGDCTGRNPSSSLVKLSKANAKYKHKITAIYEITSSTDDLDIYEEGDDGNDDAWNSFDWKALKKKEKN